MAQQAREKMVGYVRISKEDGPVEGISMQAQRARLDAYAALYAIDLVDVVGDDGFSARTLRRPGFERVVRMLEAREVDGLVVVKLDRLTRSLADWIGLIDRFFNEKKGRKLLSVNEQIDTRTANGRMMLNMLIMVAQWERETIAERSSAALQYKISIGTRCGTLRYGFDVDPDGEKNKEGRPIALVPNAAEQRTIGVIRGMAAGGYSDRAIAADLNAAGVPTKTGRGPWIHTAVARIRKRSN